MLGQEHLLNGCTPPQGEGRCLDVIRDKNILNASTSAAHRAALEGFDGPPKAGF